jgi:hypothetical protein
MRQILPPRLLLELAQMSVYRQFTSSQLPAKIWWIVEEFGRHIHIHQIGAT